MDVEPPCTARLEGVPFRDFVAELDGRAAVEARVGLLVVQGGAVGVGGRSFGVARDLGLGGGLCGGECGGERA